MRPQRTQCRDRRPTRRNRIVKGREKRVPLSPINKPALSRNRATNQRMMIGQHPSPASPQLRHQPSRTLNIGKQQGNRALRRTPTGLHPASLTTFRVSL
jgi:hypothetical protein